MTKYKVLNISLLIFIAGWIEVVQLHKWEPSQSTLVRKIKFFVFDPRVVACSVEPLVTWEFIIFVNSYLIFTVDYIFRTKHIIATIPLQLLKTVIFLKFRKT